MIIITLWVENNIPFCTRGNLDDAQNNGLASYTSFTVYLP